MARRLTEAEKERMRELRADGMSYGAIGIEVGHSKITVARACNPEAYRQTPKHKAYLKTHKQTPEYRAYTKEYNKAYRLREEVIARQTAYRNSPEYRAYKKAYNKAYQKALYQTTQGRLRIILRSRLCSAIKNGYKAGSFVRDLGCTIEQLRAYLEEQFKPGMTWDNWALDGWHIDHIKPLTSFDLTDREQFKKACHYTNLQPLWAEENFSKQDKTPEEYHQYQLAMEVS